MHLLYIYKKTPPPKNKMNKCTMCVCVHSFQRKWLMRVVILPSVFVVS